MFIISCVLSSIGKSITVLSTILGTILTVRLASTQYGFGKHIWDIEPRLLTSQLKVIHSIPTRRILILISKLVAVSHNWLSL